MNGKSNNHQTSWTHQGFQNPNPLDFIHYNVHDNEKQCFGLQLFNAIRLTMVA
jgi:hypothetical protein